MFMKAFFTKRTLTLSTEEMLRMPSLVQSRNAFLNKPNKYYIITNMIIIKQVTRIISQFAMNEKSTIMLQIYVRM